MALSLAQVAAGWPLAASLAAVAVRGVHGGRRRASLNECLHELRRPLQALALAGPATEREEAVESSLRMAAQALERLDREINGRPAAVLTAPVALEPLLRAALARWRARAELRGGSTLLRWRAGAVTVDGDAGRLEQALDNLIVNAIEHGGPRIEVEARWRGAVATIAVVDSGPPRTGHRAAPRRRRAVGAALGGRRRHGHGLRLVRRIAAEHGGEFELHRSPGRTEALLRLPLAETAELVR